MKSINRIKYKPLKCLFGRLREIKENLTKTYLNQVNKKLGERLTVFSLADSNYSFFANKTISFINPESGKYYP